MDLTPYDSSLERYLELTRPRLDWKAYFREFSRLHGDEPILHEGKLLFRDGWMYSSTSHKGPEYPPPDDDEELIRLQKAYFSHRLDVQAASAARIRGRLMEPEKGVRGLSMLREGLAWLEDDIKACEANLAELAAGRVLAFDFDDEQADDDDKAGDEQADDAEPAAGA